MLIPVNNQVYVRTSRCAHQSVRTLFLFRFCYKSLFFCWYATKRNRASSVLSLRTRRRLAQRFAPTSEASNKTCPDVNKVHELTTGGPLGASAAQLYVHKRRRLRQHHHSGHEAGRSERCFGVTRTQQHGEPLPAAEVAAAERAGYCRTLRSRCCYQTRREEVSPRVRWRNGS